MSFIEREHGPEFALQQEKIERMSTWIDDVVVLGSTLKYAQEHPKEAVENGITDYDFDEEVGQKNLETPTGVKVQYSGPGYTWTIDGGGKPITVYRGPDNPIVGSGVVTGLKLGDDEDIEFSCEHCEGEVLNKYMDEDGDVVVVADDDTEEKGCTMPPDMSHVFIEIETGRIDNNDEEERIYGECVRAPGIGFFSLLVASEVQIELITVPDQSEELCSEEFLEEEILNASRDMRQLVQDTSFRRSSYEAQRSEMEKRIRKINSYVDLTRFSAHMFFTTYFEVGAKEGIPYFEKKTAPRTKNSGEFFEASVKPLRIDSLDLRTDRKKAIRSNNDVVMSPTNLYVVAEIEPFGSSLNTDCSIIWVPLPTKQSLQKQMRASRQDSFYTDISFTDKIIEAPLQR